MKSTVRKAIRDEKGKILILVLVLLVVGGLLLTPLLGLMSTGLTAGQVYEKKAAEIYAADAGVEDAIWRMQNPDVSDLPHKECADKTWSHNYVISEVSGKGVGVTIDYLGGGIFKITSIASADGSSTTIVSYVEGEFETAVQEYEPGGGSIDGGTWIVEDGGTVDGNIEGTALVYGAGNLTVTGNIEDNASLYVYGDLTLDGTNIEDGVVICVVGDLTRNGRFENDVEVYVEGNLIVSEGIEDGARVCVQGYIVVDKIEETDEGTPTVCAGGDLTAGKIEGGYVYVGGTLTVTDDNEPSSPPGSFDDCPLCSPACPNCRICCECPLGPPSVQGHWLDWTVASYTINP